MVLSTGALLISGQSQKVLSGQLPNIHVAGSSSPMPNIGKLQVPHFSRPDDWGRFL